MNEGTWSWGKSWVWLTVVWMFAACSGDEPTIDDSEAKELDDAPGWRMYGFDLANTQYSPHVTALTPESVDELSETWRVTVGSGATSTPLVSGNTVYVGGWDGFFYAVERASGALRWKKRVGRQHVRSTPLLTQDRIYVAADRSLVALDRDNGEILFETPLIEHPQGFIDSSPKLADGVVVLGLASYELNLEKDDYTFEGSVVGLDAESGELLWDFPVTGEKEGPCTGGSGVSVWSSAAIDRERGLAYIGTGQTYEPPASTCNDTLLALHYKAEHEGQRLAWKATFTAEDVYVAAGSGLEGKDHDIGASPNLFVADGVDAVGVGDKKGTYRVFDRETGEPIWRADLDTSDFAQLGGVMTTAAVHDGTVYVASNNWTAFGFVSSGTHAEQDTATLYALDADDGSERWTKPVDAPIFGSFAIAGGLLFQPSIRGTVHARDLASGASLWKVDVGAPIGSGLSVADDGLYVASGFRMGLGGQEGEIVHYALSPSGSMHHDLRSDLYQELSVAECQDALKSLQPAAACRSCLCECDASKAGACQEGCWEQASCIVEQCGESDFSGSEGRGCYEDHCASKLLPVNVYQESLRAAECVIACADACAF